jgi:hypothetical protein
VSKDSADIREFKKLLQVAIDSRMEPVIGVPSLPLEVAVLDPSTHDLLYLQNSQELLPQVDAKLVGDIVSMNPERTRSDGEVMLEVSLEEAKTVLSNTTTSTVQ